MLQQYQSSCVHIFQFRDTDILACRKENTGDWSKIRSQCLVHLLAPGFSQSESGQIIKYVIYHWAATAMERCSQLLGGFLQRRFAVVAGPYGHAEPHGPQAGSFPSTCGCESQSVLSWCLRYITKETLQNILNIPLLKYL